MISYTAQATRQLEKDNSIGVDGQLLGVLIALLSLGLVMVFSASIAMGGDTLQTNTSFFWKQSVHIVLGLLCLLFFAFLPTDLLQKLSVPILIFSFVMLIGLLIVGLELNGSRRWISVAGFRFQPAEFAKLAMIIYAAGYLTRKRDELTRFSQGIINMGLVLFILGLLLLMQPDFGTLVVITGTVGLMMFLGGIRVTHTVFCLTLASTAIYFMVVLSPYRLQRVLSFRDPWADPFDSGFQLTQALIAVGRGEIFGVGLGASIQKLYYLPHANNDFIFAVIGEELGLLGISVVIALFALLLIRALKIARRAETVGRTFDARLAQGIGIMLTAQAVINMGVNLGALPTKGITLPFISYGGSSMLICCVAMGLLFAVDRQSRLSPTVQSGTRKSSANKAGGKK